MPLHFGFADQKTEAAMAQGFGMTPEEFRGWLGSERMQKYSIAHTEGDIGLQTGDVMSLEMFRKFFKPRYEKIWSVYKKHGIPVLHHSCGDCSQYLEDMIEIGLDMLNPVQQTAMDIRMLSERFGDSLSFFGSIDTIETLTRGTPDDVRRNVDETAEILGRNNGLLLSMLNVMPNTPFENVKAAIEQMMQYRK